MDLPPYATIRGDAVIIDVIVQPKASRDEIVGVQKGRLKIRVTAPPVEGAANRGCIELIARYLGIPKSSVSIISGASGRNKRIQIKTSDREALVSKLPHG